MPFREQDDMEWLIDLSTWRPAPDVSAQPKIQLAYWRVLMDYAGTRYLVGLLPNNATLRITTAIKTSELVSRTWRTQSGRVYETPGAPTEDWQLREQMSLLARASGLGEGSRDVTAVVWRAMQRAVQ